MFQVLVNGIIIGSIYALITIGFNLVYSAVRFYHLAYGVIGLLGAYSTHVLQTSLLGTITESPLVAFLAAVAIATAASTVLGSIVWQILYKPLRQKEASNVSMIVASFGLLIVFQNLIAWVFGPAAKSISITGTIAAGHQLGPIIITNNQIAIISLSLLGIIGFELLLHQTRLGTAIRAVGQNKDLAALVGIKTETVITATFMIATALATFSTSIIALEISLRPTFGLLLILKAIVASVIGGIGSIRGALAGGLILGIAENFGSYFFGSRWQDVIAFSLLVIFLLVLPKGIFNKSA